MYGSKYLIPISQAVEPFYWGIDIGGTNIKLGLVDDRGQTIDFSTIPTQESLGAADAVGRIGELVCSVESRLGLLPEQVPAAGLGTPGTMDVPAGLLVDPPNLPNWWHFPIRDAVAEAIGKPVSFLNDANAAAYGEYWLGTGRNHDSMILLTLGTGVGGGIIVHGELVHGRNSFGSECGHIIVDSSPTARMCSWGGGRGQLEAYGSASAVVNRTRQCITEGAQSSLQGLLGGSDTELTAKAVFLAAEQNDALATQIIDETAVWLGIGVTTLIHVIDPGLVVLGGAMDFGGPDSPVGQRFIQGIRDEYLSRTFEHCAKGTTIEFASLGGDAGYLGCAGYARKHIQSQTATAGTAQ